MAKTTTSIYESWQDVDNALRILGELQVRKDALEGEQTKKINEIKAETSLKSTYVQTQMKDIEKNIELFVEARKEEFAKDRTKNLTFGLIAFRTTRKVVCTKVKEAIKVLHVLNLKNCIRTTEALDKEECLKSDETLLLKAGIKIKLEDKLRIEPKIEKIESLAGEKDA